MKRLAGLLVGLVMLVGGIRPLHAHGGGEIKIGREPVGPYKLTVWMNPPQAQPGETIHITVGALAEDDSPLLDAEMLVTMTDVSGAIVITKPATNQQATNKLFYETDFPAPDEGLYEISVSMTRGDVSGQVAFQTEIQTTRGVNWLVVGFVGIGVVLAGALFLASRNVKIEPDIH
ncbi:MAG: hypothetical protein H6667_26240 [Ardenticatenaceae bacterium]|nr:hypothetical protein [Ardenticatenaceae bacterium]MCB9444290.1 hypothetical protein [Ardenticatenaceae bacterium]